MMRQLSAACACCLLIWLCAGSAFAARPNILFILSDDQRSDTIGAWGNRRIATPNLDRLAAAGSSFTRAYCMGSMQGAVCSPSRAMILTGRSLFRAAEKPGSGVIPTNYVTWPEHFREAGYKTIGIGKWHNDRASFARAFTDGGPIFFGGMSDHDKVPVHSFHPSGKYPNSQRVVTNVFSSELFASAAVSFLEKQTNTEPFLMYVAFTAPHDPRMPPADYARRYPPGDMALPPNFLPRHPFDNGELEIRDEQLLPWPRKPDAVRSELADYYAMITHLDAQIGRIFDMLEKTGLARNTIIVFASDHGLAIGSHGLLGKQNLYEHSIRAPLIIAGPTVPRNRKYKALCYLYDVYPTLCDLAGVPTPMTVEGKTLTPVMRGEVWSRRPAIYAAYKDVQRSIRARRWKMILYPKIDKVQIFDLLRDPYEKRNLARTKRGRRAQRELLTTFREAQLQLDDPLLRR